MGLNTVKAAFETPGMEFTVTFTGPVVAVLGTVATICVLLQLVIVAATEPLKLTVLLPCVAPKLAPAIVTETPVPPEVGDTLLTIGIVPRVTATLSKVAVARVEFASLLTAKPT